MEAYLAIAMAVGLGLLVGLQREWNASEIAGIRTFPLITLLGTWTALLGGTHANLLIAAGLLAVASLLVIANFAKLQADRPGPGMTTEAAAMIMFSVGAALGKGLTVPAIVTTGVLAVLLHWKQPLHRMVGHLDEKDFRGLIHLVLIALVILPVLPDRTYGPYDVLNPFEIWRMVVLIVGISLAAYVALRLLGEGVGAILAGILGGLISSTATTISYARHSSGGAGLIRLAALVILIASAMANVRVLLEFGIVSPSLLREAIWPFAIIFTVMAVECSGLYLSLSRGGGSVVDVPDHPAQLKLAMTFGVLYAVVLFIVAAVKQHFGIRALYGVAMLSGLTDLDAITLSTAHLFEDGRIESAAAWRVVLLAVLSNLIFKTIAVAVLGTRRLLLYVASFFGVVMIVGVALFWWWPDAH